MDSLLVETFLAVVNSRNISRAAVQLYVSQSTVSQRICMLEEELGVKLFERRKGIRQALLTADGAQFVPIARRFVSLEKEVKTFSQHSNSVSITVAGPDSIHIYLFAPFYEKLLTMNPHIDLRIRTHQSPEIYSLVDSREADIGFVFHRSNYKGIYTERILQENMVVLLSSSGSWPDRPVHPSELDSAHELYLAWSNEIVTWHDYWWPSKPYAQFDTAYMLIRNIVCNPKCWALCPVSVARSFVNDSRVIIRECSVPIPMRDLYMIISKENLELSYVKALREKLYSFIDGIKSESDFNDYSSSYSSIQSNRYI